MCFVAHDPSHVSAKFCVARFAAKKYDTKVEDKKRFANFAKNLKLIAHHNKLAEQGEYRYRLGLICPGETYKSSFMYRWRNVRFVYNYSS